MKKSAKGTRKLARQAAQDGEELIIVAGGDGTIEDVASQLVGTRTTLGIIPVGTMNNVARALGIPLILEDACALIGMGVTRSIDVGRVLANAEPALEYFLETAGIGLSAIAIPAGDAAKSGKWEAVPDALRKLFNVKPQPITLEFDDGKVIHANSQVITVSNAPLIGNNILVAPDAKMDDGMLDVAVYAGMSKADLLAHFVAAANGRRVENPNIKFYRTSRVKIIAPEPVAVHSDKDLIEAKKVLEIEVLPQKLSVITGKGIGLTLPVEAVPSVPPLSGPQPEDGNGRV
jgi:YegS/Rv2252/BmrU family lipid kinase